MGKMNENYIKFLNEELDFFDKQLFLLQKNIELTLLKKQKIQSNYNFSIRVINGKLEELDEEKQELLEKKLELKKNDE